MLLTPSNGLFLQGFLQLNTPANGNPIDYEILDSAQPLSGREGVLTPPTMLHVDVASGLWLFRSECPDCAGRCGVAAVVEFHYVTALSEIDEVGQFYGAPLRTSTLPELQLKTEVADMTVGLHTQFNTNLIGRVARPFLFSMRTAA